MDENELFDVVKDLDFFKEFEENEIKVLGQFKNNIIHYTKGERVIAEGEVGQELYVLLQGEIAITKDLAPDQELNTLNPGALFGEVPLISGSPRLTNAVAKNKILVLNENEYLSIITGPNMAGKSTYLRQIGLIVIMAQIGSNIPADYAEIGIVDKLFTRVGASDNLAEGESTFLVEMQETANIVNNATQSSLIILDEIGRGTSTYDGLSIAWAVTEYLHNHIKAKTLFATHYHELIFLADKLKKAFNLNIEVKEYNDELIFLRKIKDGGANKSYGIQVAEMAGLPYKIISRAKELLLKFSTEKTNNNTVNENNN